MIGTLESSEKRHNFTSRSPKDWEDIEDIDNDRYDAAPDEMLEVAVADRHVADRVSFHGPHVHFKGGTSKSGCSIC